MKRILIPALIALGLAVAACGAVDEPAKPKSDQVRLFEAAEKVKCDPGHIETADEVEYGVIAALECQDGRRVLLFGSQTDRNGYRQLGVAFGGVYENIGDDALLEK